MASSDPWITLGFSYAMLMEMVSDPINTVYVSLYEQEVTGTAVIQNKGAFAGYLKGIAVKEGWRNRQIGSRLIRHIENEVFSVHPNLFLCVSSFNRQAQKLYTRLGYTVIGELKDYLIPGASEILMRKSRGPRMGYIPPDR
jgi:[ribosomal protein S18]-alanine N-acetyltransferase